jgi:hypothetical protein
MSSLAKLLLSIAVVGILGLLVFLALPGGDASKSTAVSVAPEENIEEESERPTLSDVEERRSDRTTETQAETGSAEESAPALPIAEEQAPLPRSERALPLQRVDVFAFDLDGKPLSTEFPTAHLGAAVSVGAFGAQLPKGFSFKTGASRFASPGIPLRLKQTGLVEQLDLLAFPPMHVALVLGNNVLASATLKLGQEQVEFRIDPELIRVHMGALTFQVIDGQTGAALSGVNWSATILGDRLSGSGTTEDGGTITLEPWPAGPCTVELFYPYTDAGYSYGSAIRSTFEVEVLPGQLTDAGRLEIWPSVVLQGTVRDGEDQPIDASIRGYSVENGVNGATWSSDRDKGGAFRMPLTPGTWYLTVSSDEATRGGFAFPLTRVDVKRGEELEPIIIRAVASAPILLEAAAPWARMAAFKVMVPGGGTIRSGTLIQDPIWRDELPLGPYDIELIGPSGEVLQRVEIDHPETGTRILMDRL